MDANQNLIDPRIIAALIAVGGVIVSGLLAFLVTRRQVNTSINNTRIQSQTVFLEKLYEKRLDLYPELYSLLGSLGNKAKTGEASFEDIQKARNEILKWDHTNAIFLSAFSVRRMIKLRKTFEIICDTSNGQVSKKKQKINYTVHLSIYK
jgi:hypothetical protein